MKGAYHVMMDKINTILIILAVVWFVSVAAALVWNFWDPVEDEEQQDPKEKSTKEKSQERKQEKTILPHLSEYYAAIDRGDREAAIEAIKKNVEECPSRHGYCLSEVFCPECPLANGGLSVGSAREGWE